MHYVAFLRGINVGGNTKVPMKELSALFVDLGFTDVQTYLNSGNVLFRAPEGDHQKVIEGGLVKVFGLTIRVMIKTKADLEKVVKENPFAHEVIEKDRTLFVSFLFDPLSAENQKAIRELSRPEELLEPREHELYTLLVRGDFPQSFMGRSQLLTKWKTDSTARNWNTITTVLTRMS